MNPYESTLYRSFRAYSNYMRDRRNMVRTERLLNSLPAELRRDIAWPDNLPGQFGRGA